MKPLGGQTIPSELIEINHLALDALYDSYSTDEPDVYFDVLLEVSDAACKAKEALGGF
jgi:hypothetical protein